MGLQYRVSTLGRVLCSLFVWLLVVVPAGSAAAACTEVTYVTGYREVLRSREVPVTYLEAVPRTVTTSTYENQVTGYRTAYRLEERVEWRTYSTPVWDYYIVHYNLWAGGWVTSCISWYSPPNCGSHGWGWRGHWDEYVDYVAYYEYWSQPETVLVEVPYQEPVYRSVPVTTSYTVTDWVTRTSTVTEYYSESEAVLESTTVCTPPPATVVHTLTYDANGGSGEVPAAATYGSGTLVTLVSGEGLRRDGYDFAGWLDDSGGKVGGVLMDTDRTVRASWVPDGTRTYSLVYDANGGRGEPPPASNYRAGDVIVLNGAGTLFRPDHAFAGWSRTRDGGPIATVTMSSDITVHARWEKVQVRPS